MDNAQKNLEKDLNEIHMEIHISIKKGRGKKKLTSVQGLDLVERLNDKGKVIELDIFLKKIMKIFKKSLNCGAFMDDKNVITLNGDHRDKIKEYLLKMNMATEEQIKMHGY